MNFIINAFTSHLSIEAQYEFRKRLFGISEALEVQKIVFGFFLDRFKADPNERNEILNLRRFEWFGGSLTSAGLSKLLKEFLKSDSLNTKLLPETIEQIKVVISLLDGQKQQAMLIDLHRSSDFRFPFLAYTGRRFLLSLYDFSKNHTKIQQLTELTLQKLKSLKEGEKALFLAGSLMHETQISVERKKDNHWELCYYDSNRSFEIYHVEGNLLLEEDFWQTLYTLKFSTPKMASKIDIHFSQLAQPEEIPARKKEASLAPQKKNTCHFRCLLAVLKDHIIRHSRLDLDSARVEWNNFKDAFGNFLLASDELKDLELYYFSTKPQQKRHEKAEVRISFQKCILEGKHDETLAAYKAANKIADAHFLKSEKDKLKQLTNAHNALLSKLLEFPISPDQLEPFFRDIQNPWVQHTLKMYRQSFEATHEIFHLELQKELDFVSSGLNLQFESLKEAAIQTSNQAYHAVGSLARRWGFVFQPGNWIDNQGFVQSSVIEEKQLQNLLNDFEIHPEWLTYLHTKPCFVTVFIQAIQLGKLAQIERIYQKLSIEDQKYLAEKCSTYVNFFTPLLPSSIADYLIEHPKTAFAKKVSKNVCKQVLLAHDFQRFVVLMYSTNGQEGLSGLFSEIPEDKIIDALTAFESFLNKHSPKKKPPLVIEMLRAIGRILVKSKDDELLRRANQISGIPDLKPILNTVALRRFYIQGAFDQINTLLDSKVELAALEKKQIYGYHSLPSYSFSYTSENYKEGIKLLERTEPSDFLDVVFLDLINSAAKCQSKDMFQETITSVKKEKLEKHLKALSESFLSQETLIFIAEVLIAKKRYRQIGIFNRWIQFLVTDVSSIELFKVINTLLEKVEKEEGSRFIRDCFNGIKIDTSTEIENVSLECAKTILGRKILYQKMKQILSDLLLEKSYDSSADYRPKKRQFLKFWNIATKDLDLTDPKKLYHELILPVFESAFDQKEIDQVLADILHEIPSSKSYELPLAKLWCVKGKFDKAAYLYPGDEPLLLKID